ncbi:lysylphosphatidylglycerol synthase-like protein [Arcicella aurantiaca]|uniref:Lysylphosphatidylglycerol synthase-like protein n=2 Tax=Arcicella aurantiaca TaxID=591202 RepID=A0A316E8C1_9BACT|nr:lysylphosphatidylglycerol synthase-like protein [Arcicella aurantiaca]
MYLITVVLLIFFNWGFEAKKWQILVRKIENISFIDAYQSVLVGLSLGFISPANLGDFAGRLMKLKSKNRSEGIGLVLLGNGIQFYVSILFGAIAYVVVLSTKDSKIDQIIFIGVILTLILGVMVFTFRGKITAFFTNFQMVKKYENHLKALSEFDLADFKDIFLWAVLRYLTFSLQFVLVLIVFQVPLPFLQLWAISCLVLLFKTIIPPINFVTDLGVREFSALHFFNLYSVNNTSVFTATFFLWLLNILFPVIIGGFLFLKSKL